MAKLTSTLRLGPGGNAARSAATRIACRSVVETPMTSTPYNIQGLPMAFTTREVSTRCRRRACMRGMRCLNCLRRSRRTPTARVRPPEYGVPSILTLRRGVKTRRLVVRVSVIARLGRDATAKDFFSETSSLRKSSKKSTKKSVARATAQTAAAGGPRRRDREVVDVQAELE